MNPRPTMNCFLASLFHVLSYDGQEETQKRLRQTNFITLTGPGEESHRTPGVGKHLVGPKAEVRSDGRAKASAFIGVSMERQGRANSEDGWFESFCSL